MNSLGLRAFERDHRAFALETEGLGLVSSPSLSPIPSPAIEIAESCGEWIVRIVADGMETVRVFEVEAFAMAFAEGQRIRLGLAEVTRL